MSIHSKVRDTFSAMSFRTILLRDNDPAMLKALQTQLQPNYRVLTARTDDQMRSHLSSETIDLLIIEYFLGRTDGHTLIAKVLISSRSLLVC